MLKMFIPSLIVTCLAAPAAWATCSTDLDMGGNKLTNATMSNVKKPSEIATKLYVDHVLQGHAGLMISASKGQKMNFYEATMYCANLESAALNDENQEMPNIIYNDWRLPSQEEMIGICLRQGSKITYDKNKQITKENVVERGVDKEVEVYHSSNSAAKWDPSGICATEVHAEDLDKDYPLWVNNIYNVYDGFDSRYESQNQPRYVKTARYAITAQFNPTLGRFLKNQFTVSYNVDDIWDTFTRCVR